jgi:hypothetical protein
MGNEARGWDWDAREERERANLMRGMGRESGAGREGAGFGDKWELEEI